MDTLRPLTLADLPAALALSDSAGWNQLADDWRRYLTLSPGLVLGIESNGTLAASACATVYGGSLAWIGMVLTLPDYRGRGFASRLLQALFDKLADVPTLKLDATDLGRPVYERFGFVEEYVVERWKGTLPPSAHPPQTALSWPPVLDFEAFGADRSALLASLELTRPGRVASYFGPLVCQSPDEARTAVENCGLAGPVFWDIPEPNAPARALAASLGFTPVRRLFRMRKGAPLAERPDLVYALAGFEFG